MLCAEQLLGAVDSQLLDVVHQRDALVVARSRIALRVLDVEMARQALEHRGRGVILAGDEVQRAVVPVAVALQKVKDLRVSRPEISSRPSGNGHGCRAKKCTSLELGADEQTQESGLAEAPRQGEKARRERADRDPGAPKL